jgi:nucleoid-associated protein YgaU
MGLLDKILGNDDDDKKKKADFSNVQSGSSSTAPAPAATTSSMGASTAARTYTVVSGDSLSKIAKREYGDANKWRAIFEANRDKIKDPDLIHPGQVLTIPSA